MYNGGGSRADYYYHRTPSFDPTEDTIILNPPLLKRGTLRCSFFAISSYRGTFPSLISSINASATFGSNWVPLFFSSSPIAYSTLSASL